MPLLLCLPRSSCLSGCSCPQALSATESLDEAAELLMKSKTNVRMVVSKLEVDLGRHLDLPTAPGPTAAEEGKLLLVRLPKRSRSQLTSAGATFLARADHARIFLCSPSCGDLIGNGCVLPVSAISRAGMSAMHCMQSGHGVHCGAKLACVHRRNQVQGRPVQGLIGAAASVGRQAAEQVQRPADEPGGGRAERHEGSAGREDRPDVHRCQPDDRRLHTAAPHPCVTPLS